MNQLEPLAQHKKYEPTLAISAPAGAVGGVGHLLNKPPKAGEAKAKTKKRVAIIFMVLQKFEAECFSMKLAC